MSFLLSDSIIAVLIERGVVPEGVSRVFVKATVTEAVIEFDGFGMNFGTKTGLATGIGHRKLTDELIRRGVIPQNCQEADLELVRGEPVRASLRVLVDESVADNILGIIRQPVMPQLKPLVDVVVDES